MNSRNVICSSGEKKKKTKFEMVKKLKSSSGWLMGQSIQTAKQFLLKGTVHPNIKVYTPFFWSVVRVAPFWRYQLFPWLSCSETTRHSPRGAQGTKMKNNTATSMEACLSRWIIYWLCQVKISSYYVNISSRIITRNVDIIIKKNSNLGKAIFFSQQGKR